MPFECMAMATWTGSWVVCATKGLGDWRERGEEEREERLGGERQEMGEREWTGREEDGETGRSEREA